jgi:hypothetical protein
MAKKPLGLREPRGLRASLSSSGFLRAHISRRVPLFPGRRKTRTEFTEGLTDIELGGPSGPILDAKQIQSVTLYSFRREQIGTIRLLIYSKYCNNI